MTLTLRALLLGLFTAIVVSSCNKSGSGTSYNFTATGSTRIAAPSRQEKSSSPLRVNDSCSSMFCLTPTTVSGQYFGTGLLIQSGGSGMSAYFGQSIWSDITGTSPTYSFDTATPVTNSGTLTCCAGSGDLSSSNTYIEDVSFLIGYIDVTFTLGAGTGVQGTAIGTHTVRFILADDVISGARRGDLQYSDSGTLKWMDSTGAMSTTRPTSPVTMNSSVVNWSNPWGTTGNQTIPVIYAPVRASASNDNKLTVTEAQLKTTGRTYSFTFPSTDLIIFPSIIANQDEGMISSRLVMMQKIHLQGLPHSTATLGKAGTAGLTVTEP